jgi:hypothetical protein
MPSYRDRRKAKEKEKHELLKAIYQLAAHQVEHYQKQRYLSIGFIIGLEVTCIAGFGFLPHAPTDSLASKLIVMAGYIFLPTIAAVVLGGLWLNENRLKDYYSKSFDMCIEAEKELAVSLCLFTRLRAIQPKTILSLDHTQYFRGILLMFIILWLFALSFGIAEAIQMWYK